MTAVYLFLSTYCVVFFLATQSLVVNRGKMAFAFINSFAIGASQLALYKLAPDATGFELAAYLLGGPFGVISAMFVFSKLDKKEVA